MCSKTIYSYPSNTLAAWICNDRFYCAVDYLEYFELWPYDFYSLCIYLQYTIFACDQSVRNGCIIQTLLSYCLIQKKHQPAYVLVMWSVITNWSIIYGCNSKVPYLLFGLRSICSCAMMNDPKFWHNLELLFLFYNFQGSHQFVTTRQLEICGQAIWNYQISLWFRYKLESYFSNIRSIWTRCNRDNLQLNHR